MYAPSEHALARLSAARRKVTRGFAPPPALTVTEWSNRYRYLSPESSSEPGKFQVSRRPYTAEIMNAFNDYRVKKVVLVASAQVAKTTILENVAAYHMHLNPVPMMIIQPTIVLAESFSKDRISAMIRDTPVLRDIVHEANSRSSGNTILQKKFPGGHLTMTGANSPTSLRSRPISLVLGDEIDAYPDSAEGDPLILAEARTKAFPNAKIGYFSTPTTEGLSRIDREYTKSDQRVIFLPCPNCLSGFVLGYEPVEGVPTALLKWTEGTPSKKKDGSVLRRADDAWFECPHCQFKVYDDLRERIIADGEWRPRAEFRGTAGFWLWEANNPDRRAIDAADAWLSVQGDSVRMKGVKNTVFGLPWKETGIVMEWRKLYDRAEAYSIATVPEGPKVLFGAVDVQKDRLEIYVYGYGDNMEQWLIDHQVIEGDPDQAGTWRQLSSFINAVAYPGPEGSLFHVFRWAVDSGYLAGRVYEWSAKFPPEMVYVVKGEEKGPGFWKRGVDLEAGPNGAKYKTGHALYLLSKMQLIDRFYSWLSQPPPTREALAEGAPYPTGYLHTPEMPEEYFRQLTADVKINGKYKDKVNFHRNEALDIKVYCDFLADISWVSRYEAAKKPLPTVTGNPHQQAPQQTAVASQAPQRRIRGSFGN